MPSNLTVKKNDDSTDVVYTAVVGASGDTPAQYRAPALGATASTKPELRIINKKVPRKGALTRTVATMMRPYSVLNTTTGITTVEKRLYGRVELDFDPDVPATEQDEFVSQFFNLLDHADVKAQFKAGQAAV
jgi:hypothetical protein